MSPKILLTFQASKKRKLYVNTLPPLGILGIASYLQENNIAVDIFDHNIDNGAGFNLRDYDIIGLSVNTANISASLDFIKYIKTQNSKAKVVAGGPSCISNP